MLVWSFDVLMVRLGWTVKVFAVKITRIRLTARSRSFAPGSNEGLDHVVDQMILNRGHLSTYGW